MNPEPEMKPTETVESGYDRYEMERQARAAASKAELLTILGASPSIKSISIEYDGSGDSGTIEEITFFDAATMPIEATAHLSDLVEEVVYDLLPGGWEIDAGAYGTCTIDAESGNMSFEHYARYEDVLDHSFEVELKGGE